MPAWTWRLTSSGYSIGAGSPLALASAASACSIAVSKAMARSTEGSPAILRKQKEISPATRPNSMPRTSSFPVIETHRQAREGSMTGEAEQMASVVQELMHIHAVENGRRTFLDADKIQAKQKQQAAEDRPGQNLANGNDRRGGHWKRT